MAAQNVLPDNGISDFILDGSPFSYDRLAEDVLSKLYDAFKVEKRLIPPPRFAENSYKNSLAIHHIARQSILEQIVYRGVWYDFFTKKDATLRTQNDTTKLSEFVADYMKSFTDEFVEIVRKCTPALLFHISFAFIVELTLFLIMKKKGSVIKKMSRVWVRYFSKNLKEAFETVGGLSQVFQETYKSNVTDIVVFDFIRTHCVPYSGKPVFTLFLDALDKERAERNVSKKLKRQIEGLGIHAGRSKPSSLENAESVLDPTQGLKIHERLGLVPHEDVLRKYVVAKSPQEISPLVDTDESAAKSITSLSLQAGRGEAKEFIKERSPFSTPKARLYHNEEKEPVANTDALNVVPVDEGTIKAIRALSLQAERRKAKKILKEQNPIPMSKTHWYLHKEKKLVTNTSASSVEIVEEPEARPCDKVFSYLT